MTEIRVPIKLDDGTVSGAGWHIELHPPTREEMVIERERLLSRASVHTLDEAEFVLWAIRRTFGLDAPTPAQPKTLNILGREWPIDTLVSGWLDYEGTLRVGTLADIVAAVEARGKA